MGPLSFLNGAFLAALAAAALPILIHLFSRRRVREQPFAHLLFLDEITKRKVRRMRLRQWLLLALRTLAIALLALALSRPVWHGPGAGSQRGSSTVAILVDDSFSMEARLDPQAVLPVAGERGALGGATRFAEARQRALQVVDLLEEGDRAILVFTGSPLRVPYESTVRDPALLREELQRAAPRPVRSDLPGALERVQGWLAAAKTLNREIFIISDFQAAQAEAELQRLGGQVQPGGGGAPATDTGEAQRQVEQRAAEPGADTTSVAGAAAGGAPTGRPLLAIPAETRVYTLPVTTGGTQNVAVTGARFDAAPDGAGGRLTVRLENFGSTPVRELLVRALADGESGATLAEGFITLEGGAAAQTVLTLSDAPASGRLAVRSANDILLRDNLRYVATAATERLRLLLVTGGDPNTAEMRAEARFVTTALDPWSGGPRPVGGEPPRFEIEAVAESDLGLRSRIDADLVLLLNVGRLSAAAGEVLERFHAEGGGIFIALGNRVDPRLYNTQLLERLGAVRLENVVGELDGTRHFTLRPEAIGHEIFAGFPIAPGGALSGAKFYRLVDARPGARTRLLAGFSGGHPALLEEAGLLLFTSALDLSWSDFPTSAAFLPFLHRALLHVARGGGLGQHELRVGTPLRWPLPAGAGGEGLRYTGPGGFTVGQSLVETERGPVLVSEPVPEAGFYRLAVDPALAGPNAAQQRNGAPETGTPARGTAGGHATELFAVNVDTRESRLEAMTPEAGALLFGAERIRIAPAEDIERQVSETRYGRELWRLCLALAFALLLLESLIARGREIA